MAATQRIPENLYSFIFHWFETGTTPQQRPLAVWCGSNSTSTQRGQQLTLNIMVWLHCLYFIQNGPPGLSTCGNLSLSICWLIWGVWWLLPFWEYFRSVSAKSLHRVLAIIASDHKAFDCCLLKNSTDLNKKVFVFMCQISEVTANWFNNAEIGLMSTTSLSLAAWCCSLCLQVSDPWSGQSNYR